jgi:hypothetical protein
VRVLGGSLPGIMGLNPAGGMDICVLRWRSWLRHCATNRKVTGSVPDGVTGIFQCLDPSGRTVALVSTQPLTEMSTRNSSWG